MRAQGGKILACAACEESQSVASASAAGSVHVWRVEYTSRSGGAPDRFTGIIGARPPTAHPKNPETQRSRCVGIFGVQPTPLPSYPTPP